MTTILQHIRVLYQLNWLPTPQTNEEQQNEGEPKKSSTDSEDCFREFIERSGAVIESDWYLNVDTTTH